MRKLLLKVSEVVEATGLCRSMVYAKIAAGVIPSIKIGEKSIRVPLIALNDWIQREMNHGSSEAELEAGSVLN